MMGRACIVVVLLVLSSGCDKKQNGTTAAMPAAAKPATDTNPPTTQSIEVFAKKFLVEFEKGQYELDKTGRGTPSRKFRLLSTDIKRTDSVVHPFVCEVLINEDMNSSGYLIKKLYTFNVYENPPESGHWELLKAASKVTGAEPETERIYRGAEADLTAIDWIRTAVHNVR